MKIITHNVFLLNVPPFSVGPETMSQRVDLMNLDSLYHSADILILNEAFTKAPVNRLISGLEQQGLKYRTPVLGTSGVPVNENCNGNQCWNAVSGNWDILQLENGGVTILSRYNLLRRESLVFSNKGCGADRLATKGAVYVKLQDEKAALWHVFATHLQADDGGCLLTSPASVRKAQLGEILSWIASKNIPDTEKIILAGDLNIDKDSAEYDDLLRVMQEWTVTSYLNVRKTWDTINNGLAKYGADGTPPCYLDYIFGRNVSAVSVKTLNVHASGVYSYAQHEFSDYSDHYPVLAEII